MKIEVVILALGALILGGLALWPLLAGGEDPAGTDSIGNVQGELIVPGLPAVGSTGAPGSGHNPSHGVQDQPRPPRSDGAEWMSWSRLAGYRYALPDPSDDASREPRPTGQIPAEVLALSGSRIAIEGFMMPIRVDEEGRVREFLFSRYVGGCCFGAIPQMNEWAEVIMAGDATCDYVSVGTVTVVGTLEVGEAFDEYGYVTSVYRIRATSAERTR